ncbi:unnamed protein product [Neospora caninum Liverpool]|uniref:Microneme protein, putative n=1 Tax=Neospora caninum (strain Liverpool) TaxID=572307 RepID=F0V9H8_NEOCL|nr:uncharacterized protein NCLIV_008720 [Neospora caninum Liverpool]CBZ50403.1 unnamed protein product [Neospora caninum Liverpool]CEL65011.1 TPA: microneme protein, putative [Neospora caninum Liverpool]|eukprot:XP_003880437.1 uncharacterized protein NCLIV_008720 [Neospora caninum Liverpool]
MKLESFSLAALSAVLFASKAEAAAVNCFKADTDYFGYDVEKIFVGAATESAEKCQQACKSKEECYYFTYIPDRKQCYLKDSQAPNGAVTNPLAISGPKVCSPAGTCYEYMTDYYGYDLQKIEDQSVPHADDCQRLCAANDQCHYWTFIPSKFSCYLKYNGATVGRTPHSEAISGPKSCGGSSPEGNGVPCYEADTDYFGYDIKIFDNNLVGTAEECYGLCLSFNECKYWTWVPALRNCYLKSEYAPLGRVHAPGTMSGPRDCNGSNLPPWVPPPPVYPPIVPVPPPSPYPPYPSPTTTTTASTTTESCYKSHVEYPSGTLRHLVTDSAVACQKLCQAEHACFFFTFKADILECTLKDSTAGNTPIPRRHTLSGSKFCADIMPPEFQPLENHIPTPPLPSPPQIPPAYPGPFPDPSPPNTVQVPSCAEVNVEYVSDILSVLGADSPQECQTLCKLTASCNYFTYRSDLYRCYLSTKQGTAAVRVNAFAGPKECPNDPVLPPSTGSTCFMQNKLLVGNLVETTTAASALKCQEKCASTPKCNYFSFQIMSTSCHMFRQVNGVKEEGTTVSGPKKCADSQATDPCFNEGFHFGQVLKRHNGVSSAKECQQLCASFPHSCVGFTYENASQKCFLMSQTDGIQINAAFVAGPRQCPTF